MYYVEKPDAHLKRALAAIGYSGRKIAVTVTRTVNMVGGYWDGGSMTRWTLLTWNGRDWKTETVPAQGPFDTAVDWVRHYTLREDVVAAAVHHFGSNQSVELFVSPDNAARLVPAPVKVTALQFHVLDAAASYVASYGGERDFRLDEMLRLAREGRYGDGGRKLTAADILAAREECKALGLLDARGAITAAGKNARLRKIEDAADGRD